MILLRVVNSDKAIMDQVSRRNQGTNNLESSAQFSAAQQVRLIGVIFATSREDETRILRMYLLDKSNCRL
jgi:hypothetical protein